MVQVYQRFGIAALAKNCACPDEDSNAETLLYLYQNFFSVKNNFILLPQFTQDKKTAKGRTASKSSMKEQWTSSLTYDSFYSFNDPSE